MKTILTICLLAFLGACGEKPSESPASVVCNYIESGVYDCEFALVEIKADENGDLFMEAKKK
jgi:hypothetical protein